MKTAGKIFVVALILLGQLLVVYSFVIRPVNLAKVPYRAAERYAAEMAWITNRSAENKAAFDRESNLAATYALKQQLPAVGLVYVGILCMELVIYHSLRQDARNVKPMA
jgi:hypothetical protein